MVRLYEPGGVPDIQSIAHTNFCDLGIRYDAPTGRAVIVAAIDNLGKGAAGQAIQEYEPGAGVRGNGGSALNVRILVKLGGTLLDDADSRRRLAREIAASARGNEMVVVHGGGKQMTRYLTERGVESRFVNGLRVTTPEILDAVLKIFAGTVNTELVAALRSEGVAAVGLTGVDAGLVDAEPLNPDLGHVGRPAGSDPRLLEVLVREGFLPVVACVAGDSAGHLYNVNGDQMAVACATAFAVEKLVFLTDVDGVRDASGAIRPVLDAEEARHLIHSGVATGGMQAKLEAALCQVTNRHHNNVVQVHICPGSYPGILETKLNPRRTHRHSAYSLSCLKYEALDLPTYRRY